MHIVWRGAGGSLQLMTRHSSGRIKTDDLRVNAQQEFPLEEANSLGNILAAIQLSCSKIFNVIHNPITYVTPLQ